MLLKERQHRSEYLALSAHLHLLVPVFMHFALTDRPIDKPAKLPTLKFPCRAISPHPIGTLPYHPTRLVVFITGPHHRQKKVHLSLDIHRDVPPSLLKTLYGFGRNTQELRHLSLSFSDMGSNLGELLFVHVKSSGRFFSYDTTNWLNVKAFSPNKTPCISTKI